MARRPPKAHTAPVPHDVACLPPLLPADRLSWAPTPSSLLGSGTYGAIYRGTLDGSTPVAVKLIRRRSVLPTGGGGARGGDTGAADGAAPPSTAPLTREARKAVRAAGRFATEVATYARLTHPCLVQFVGIASAYRSAPTVPSLLVMEYMAGGSLAGGLATARAAGVAAGGVPLPTVIRVLADVAAGVAYLHGQTTLHGRLSATNILLTEPLKWDVGGDSSGADEGNDGDGGDGGDIAGRSRWGGTAKVADFALARCMDTDADDGGGAATALHESTMDRTGGALRTAYVPPEAFSQRVPRWERDLAADVYAWGILAQELLTVQPPWAALIAEKGAGGGAPAIAEAVQAGERPPWGAVPVDGPTGEVRSLADAAMGHAWRGRPPIGTIASAIEALAGRLGVARTGTAAVPSAPPAAAMGAAGGGRCASRSWTSSRWDIADLQGAPASRPPPPQPTMSLSSPPEGDRRTPPPPMASLGAAEGEPPLTLPFTSSLRAAAPSAAAPSAPPAVTARGTVPSAAARSATTSGAARGRRPPPGPTAAHGGAWLHMDIHGSLAEEYARFEQEETTEDRRRASVLLGQDEERAGRGTDGHRRHTTGDTTRRVHDRDGGSSLQPVVNADDILSAVSLVNTMSEEHSIPTDTSSRAAASRCDNNDSDSDGSAGRGIDGGGSVGGVTRGSSGSHDGGLSPTAAAAEVATNVRISLPRRHGLPRGTTWAARSDPEGDNGLADTTARGMLWGWLQERVDERGVVGGGRTRSDDSPTDATLSPRVAEDLCNESSSPPPSPVEVVTPVSPTPPQVETVTRASPPPPVVVITSASPPLLGDRATVAGEEAASTTATASPPSTSPSRSAAPGTAPTARATASADDQTAAPWWSDRPSGRPWPTHGGSGQNADVARGGPARQGTPIVMGPRHRGGAIASVAVAPSVQTPLQSPPRMTPAATTNAFTAASGAVAPEAVVTSAATAGSLPLGTTSATNDSRTADAPVAVAAYDSPGDDDTIYDACDVVATSPLVEEIIPVTAVAAPPTAMRVPWADDVRQRAPAGRPVRRTPGGHVDAAAAMAAPRASAMPVVSSGAVTPRVPAGAAARTAAAVAAPASPSVVGTGGATLPGDKRLSPQLPLPDGVYRGCNITVVLRPTTTSEPLMDGSAAAAAAATAAETTGEKAATAGSSRGGRRSLDTPPVAGGGGGGGGSHPGGSAAMDTRRSCQLPDSRRRRVRLGISSKVSSLLWRE
ncbi:hypothetical protein MMPV_003745 [Pyropia vietnamensis]